MAAAQDLSIVDPHIHLWDTRYVRYPWLERRGLAFSGDNRLLPDPYLVQQLLREATDVEVLRSVHVEANPADAVTEVQWLQALADDPVNRGHPHGIVAYADLTAADVAATLERLSAFRNVRGIRQIVNRHEDVRYNYVDRDFLNDPIWRANLRRLLSYNWSFDLQLYPHQVSSALEVIESIPGLTFIVNHTGMFVDRSGALGWRQWRQALRDLASYSNVAIKISGLAMFDHEWTIESFRPYVLQAIDVFGADRCLFASNFPIDRLHGSYGALWRAYTDLIDGAAEPERERMLRSNAIRYYRLQPL